MLLNDQEQFENIEKNAEALQIKLSEQEEIIKKLTEENNKLK